jgi:hypothetical protein
MTEVPASAIPEGAWGLHGEALTAEQVAAEDPFLGYGVRLDGLPGRTLMTDDVHEATGLSQVIIHGGATIWVRLEPGYSAEGVRSSWQAWLTREEVTGSP